MERSERVANMSEKAEKTVTGLVYLLYRCAKCGPAGPAVGSGLDRNEGGGRWRPLCCSKMGGYYWLLGATLSAIGSISSNMGVNLQKYSFLQNSKLPKAEQKSYFRQVRWVMGLILVILGSLGDFAALGMTAQSIVAPVGATTLVANTMFAHYFLGEALRKEDILGTCMIVVGCIIAVLFGEHAVNTYTIEDLKSYYSRPLFLIYAISVTLLFFLLYYLLKKKVEPLSDAIDEEVESLDLLLFEEKERSQLAEQECEEKTNADHGNQNVGTARKPITPEISPAMKEADNSLSQLERKYKRWEKFHPFSYCCLSGIFGSGNLLFGKMVAELLASTFAGQSQLGKPLTWVFVICMVATIFTQLHWLAMALSQFDAMYCVPVFQCFHISFSTIGGACYFEEFNNFSAVQAIVFPLGFVLTLSGVYVLSSRSMGQMAKLDGDRRAKTDDEMAQLLHASPTANGQPSASEPQAAYSALPASPPTPQSPAPSFRFQSRYAQRKWEEINGKAPTIPGSFIRRRGSTASIYQERRMSKDDELSVSILSQAALTSSGRFDDISDSPFSTVSTSVPVPPSSKMSDSPSPRTRWNTPDTRKHVSKSPSPPTANRKSSGAGKVPQRARKASKDSKQVTITVMRCCLSPESGSSPSPEEGPQIQDFLPTPSAPQAKEQSDLTPLLFGAPENRAEAMVEAHSQVSEPSPRSQSRNSTALSPTSTKAEASHVILHNMGVDTPGHTKFHPMQRKDANLEGEEMEPKSIVFDTPGTDFAAASPNASNKIRNSVSGVQGFTKKNRKGSVSSPRNPSKSLGTLLQKVTSPLKEPLLGPKQSDVTGRTLASTLTSALAVAAGTAAAAIGAGGADNKSYGVLGDEEQQEEDDTTEKLVQEQLAEIDQDVERSTIEVCEHDDDAPREMGESDEVKLDEVARIDIEPGHVGVHAGKSTAELDPEELVAEFHQPEHSLELNAPLGYILAQALMPVSLKGSHARTPGKGRQRRFSAFSVEPYWESMEGAASDMREEHSNEPYSSQDPDCKHSNSTLEREQAPEHPERLLAATGTGVDPALMNWLERSSHPARNRSMSEPHLFEVSGRHRFSGMEPQTLVDSHSTNLPVRKGNDSDLASSSLDAGKAIYVTRQEEVKERTNILVQDRSASHATSNRDGQELDQGSLAVQFSQ
eukprot:g3986.t1